jgi:hypothetical protein
MRSTFAITAKFIVEFVSDLSKLDWGSASIVIPSPFLSVLPVPSFNVSIYSHPLPAVLFPPNPFLC